MSYCKHKKNIKDSVFKIYITLLITICSHSAFSQSYQIERWNSNGANVAFYAASEVPMLQILVAFAAGSAYDEGQYGIADITAQLLDQGTKKLSANAIAEKLADTGAQYQEAVSQDMAAFQLKTLTEPDALKNATELFIQILSDPDFPTNAIKRVKKQQIVSIRQSQDDPAQIATKTFFRSLYQTHPYAHPVEGIERTVADINRLQIQKFYQRYYNANNATIVIVGAIDHKKAQEIADKISQSLKTGKQALKIPLAKPLKDAKEIKINYPSSQTMLRIGELGIDCQCKDFFPLLVGNRILGGSGLVSLLNQEVRQKRGLTYGAYSQFIPLQSRGPFIIGLSTQNSQADKAGDVVQQTLSEFINNGPNETSLKQAKLFLSGSFPLSLASNQNLAGTLLKIAFYQLPKDYLDTYLANIEAVTKTDVTHAMQQYIHPEKLLQVSVGKQ